MEELNKIDLLRIILEDDKIEIDDEEIYHLLINRKVSSNANEAHQKGFSFGDRMSDRLATAVGSWGFILGFLFFMFAWVGINIYFATRAFDPYPFILLNLALSCIAAIQAPIIMMSQNRQEEKDRLRSKNDYKVNLKSELIVEDLHRKLDSILENQAVIQERLDRLER